MAAGITPQEHRERRAELRKSLDGVMVLFGAEEPDDLHTSFFQESNFLYLSGWREPDETEVFDNLTVGLISTWTDSNQASHYARPRSGQPHVSSTTTE